MLNSISREFAKESIALPPELRLWFSGRKAEVLVKVSNERVWEIYASWEAWAVMMINSRMVTWSEFFSVFPEPFGSQLRAALIKIIDAEKKCHN